MAGFDALYKQTVTLFNRINLLTGPSILGQMVLGVTKLGGSETDKRTYDLYWAPILLKNVHLIVDRSIIVSTYGEQSSDNARLHIRYLPSGSDALIQGARYYQPKEWKRLPSAENAVSLKFGDDFDFFVEGDLTSYGLVRDDDYRDGFFNYMNAAYDNCFAISSVTKFNIIPHFEVGAR